ncbi:unnamed protein product [Sympodiomycopsis kandeliae]
MIPIVGTGIPIVGIGIRSGIGIGIGTGIRSSSCTSSGGTARWASTTISREVKRLRWPAVLAKPSYLPSTPPTTAHWATLPVCGQRSFVTSLSQWRSTDTHREKAGKPTEAHQQDSSDVKQVNPGKPKIGDYMDSSPPKYTSDTNTNFKLNLLFFAATGIAGGGALLLFSYLRPMISNEADHDDTDKKEGFAPTIEDSDSDHPNRLLRVLNRIASLINDVIIEPIGTAKRFIVLFALFFPVLLTMPMLLVGRKGVTSSRKRKGNHVNGDSATYVDVDNQDRWGAIWWFNFLVKQMERAGPTFIKLAQWAGSRQDLFPESLCERLGKLHSNGKPHSLRYTKRVIERVFGRKFDDIFVEFKQEPLGIGAVAQVYKAKLRPDVIPPGQQQRSRGRSRSRSKAQVVVQQKVTSAETTAAVPDTSVAIKILHPKVHRTIARDIRIMKFFANLINAFPGAEWLSFPEEVEVFAGMMFSQLDLRNEAKNLLRFETNFSTRKEAISFPGPLSQFSTKELLIEQYEDALPLKHFLRNGGAGFDHRIATLGLDTFLYMLLLDNFTHADLHPGNIMIKFFHPTRASQFHSFVSRILAPFDSDYKIGGPKGPPNADDQAEQEVVRRLQGLKHDQEGWLSELDRLDSLGYQPELVLLDAGLTVELTPLNRRNFLDLFSAVAEFDGELAGTLMVERCRTPDLVVDKEGFAMKMQSLILSVKSKTFSLAQIKISDVLSQVLIAVRDHHVKMEADFVNTVISILLLEGIGRQLDPSMDLFASSLPILRSLGKQLSKQEASTKNLREMSPMLKVWFWLETKSWLEGLADTETMLSTYGFA